MSWSSGKDSAWALGLLLADPGVEVVGLLTTVNLEFGRVAMHAVRESLLEAQARAIGLPLHRVGLPFPCDNERYEEIMGRVVVEARERGVTHMAFGDLFLEDIRVYRERKLKGTGLEPIFPLWGRETRALAEEMVQGGLVSHLTCIDPAQLSPEFVGRRFDGALLRDLPEGVDPCGERGEFHSFVSQAPYFREAIDVELGERVLRDGFWFADLSLRS